RFLDRTDDDEPRRAALCEQQPESVFDLVTGSASPVLEQWRQLVNTDQGERSALARREVAFASCGVGLVGLVHLGNQPFQQRDRGRLQVVGAEADVVAGSAEAPG